MIGLIFGETKFPIEILKTIKNKKKYIIIDLTKKKIFKKNKNSYTFSIGQFGKIINTLKENKCKKVLFAGKVSRPNFKKIKLDLKGIYYIPRIIKSSKIGDTAILKEIIKIFKEEKIKTVSSLSFTPHLTLKKGNYTKIKPNQHDRKNIIIAIKALSKTNEFSFSQGAIVRNNRIIAIEDKTGTEKMLLKFTTKTKINTGVLVKLPKKKQDLRIDLPTIGIDTLIQCKAASLKGLVLKGSQNVIINKKKSIAFANKNKMFIKVI